MAICGNRAKASAFAKRKRAEHENGRGVDSKREG
jgi:hypothetical protein